MMIDRAFSAVVADNQYAALGLMLLGTLARVKTVIRPLGKKEIDDEQEVEVVGKSEDLAEDVGDDLGEVVMRETLDSLSVENDEQVPDEADEDDEFRLQNRRSTEKRKRTSETGESRTEATVERTPTKPSKKKKRKKGDVFDVLFDSLI
jgi:ribonuclease MRP protein subunit RMP1